MEALSSNTAMPGFYGETGPNVSPSVEGGKILVPRERAGEEVADRGQPPGDGVHRPEVGAQARVLELCPRDLRRTRGVCRGATRVRGVERLVDDVLREIDPYPARSALHRPLPTYQVGHGSADGAGDSFDPAAHGGGGRRAFNRYVDLQAGLTRRLEHAVQPVVSERDADKPGDRHHALAAGPLRRLEVEDGPVRLL